MSFLSNWIMPFKSLFKKYLGRIAEPKKNPTNAMTNVMTKLVEGLLIDNSKNDANIKSTIKGLKICSFKIMFLFKRLKKFSLGYSLLK